MVRYIKIIMFFFIFGMITFPVAAQWKYEKESRIQKKRVPKKARDFIQSLSPENKVKWYLEEGVDRKSLEAKFKFNHKKFSVEFDTLGHLEDVEIEIDQSSLPANLLDTINMVLEKDCEKNKIRKIQLQYLGEVSVILDKIKKNKNTGNIFVRYEMVVRCNHHNQVHLFEYLFDDVGQMISVVRIEQKNSSHLEY